MSIVKSFDNLQTVAPEIEITHLHASCSGFCSLGIQLPEEIELFFKQLLEKSKKHTDGKECDIQLYPDGRIAAEIILPDRYYSFATQEEHR